MSGLETPLRTLVRKPNSLSFDLRPSIDKLTISALFILSPDVFNIHGDFGVPSKYNNRFSKKKDHCELRAYDTTNCFI
uniref:Uncharacterized protein n=1 Tax=Glossina palpalis gambiensis TaxID=67801 RepID=A0A1B0BK49_9MUSC